MSRLLGWSAKTLSRCDNLFSFSLLRGSSALAVVVRFQSFPLLGPPQHLLWLSAAFSSYPPVGGSSALAVVVRFQSFPLQHLLWSSAAFSSFPCQGLLSTCCGLPLPVPSFPLVGAPQHLLWSSVAFSTSPQHLVVSLAGLSLAGALVRDF